VETLTPTELAVQLWGSSEDFSRSQGARKVRRVARQLYPKVGKGNRWHFTPDQVAAIRGRIDGR
jgi:hypothetical protein